MSKILKNKIDLIYNINKHKFKSKNGVVIDDLVADDGEDNKKISKNQRIKRRKAVMAFQDKFRNRINLKIDQVKQSMNNKVKDIKIVPTGIGRNKKGEILGILKKSYQLALKQILTENFKVYAYIHIKNDNGDPVEASTDKYDKTNIDELLNDLLHKIERQIQSATKVLLKDLSINFNFIEIPSGGAFNTSTEINDILNKNPLYK